jgi:DNA-binding transcriptional MerR regulator
MDLAELAQHTEISARTIRFYIARGLLPGPEGGGRGAKYGQGHVEKLREIQRLQESGLTLAEIGMQGSKPSALPEPERQWSYAVAEGVEVRVSGNLPPWRVRHVRRALAEFAAQLRDRKSEIEQE